MSGTPKIAQVSLSAERARALRQQLELERTQRIAAARERAEATRAARIARQHAASARGEERLRRIAARREAAPSAASRTGADSRPRAAHSRHAADTAPAAATGGAETAASAQSAGSQPAAYANAERLSAPPSDDHADMRETVQAGAELATALAESFVEAAREFPESPLGVRAVAEAALILSGALDGRDAGAIAKATDALRSRVESGEAALLAHREALGARITIAAELIDCLRDGCSPVAYDETADGTVRVRFQSPAGDIVAAVCPDGAGGNQFAYATDESEVRLVALPDGSPGSSCPGVEEILEQLHTRLRARGVLAGEPWWEGKPAPHGPSQWAQSASRRREA